MINIKKIKYNNLIIIKTDECNYIFNENSKELKPVYISEDIPKSFDSLEWLEIIEKLENGHDEDIDLPKNVLDIVNNIKKVPTFDLVKGYHQSNNCIMKWDKEKENTRIIAIDGYFKSVKINIDILKYNAESLEIIYYDNITNEDKILKGSKQDIINEFKSYMSVVNLNQFNDIDYIINILPYRFNELNLLVKNYYYSINGYFLHNNDFVDNSDLGNEFKGLKIEDIKEELEKAISLLNEYFEVDNREQTINIFKYSLVSPYFYLFKQLDIQELNKYIILHGNGKTGKSTTVFNSLLFYGIIKGNNKPISTAPSLRNALNGRNTMPFLIDESTKLFSESKFDDLIKRNAYNIYIDEKANKNDFNKNDVAIGFRTVFFTQNKSQYLFTGVPRRTLTYEYIDIPKNKENFNKKFKFNGMKRSNLYILRYIGYAFSLCVKDSLKSGLLFECFNNPNEYINSILKQIERYSNVKFNPDFLKSNPFESENKLAFDNLIDGCIPNIFKIYWNNKKQFNNFIEFLKNSPLLQGVLKADGNYYYATESKFKKFLYKYANQNPIKIEDYCKELGINFIDVSDKGWKDIEEIYLKHDNVGAIMLKTFNDEAPNKTIKGKSQRKTYILNFKAVEQMFNINGNVEKNITNLEDEEL